MSNKPSTDASGGETNVSTTTQRCGGHITLLFTVEKANPLMRNQGSRGAGFSIHHGVEATGSLRLRAGGPKAWMSGITPDKPVDKKAHDPPKVSVVNMRGEHVENTDMYLDFIQACYDATLLRESESLEVNINLQCPTSQGFGMSSAGLIALGRLVHKLTGRGTGGQYLKIAHRIERTHGSGLGDVLGASVGGVELRLEPGAPGWPGRAVSFAVDVPVLLAWDPLEERHTATYIDDPAWQSSITKAGAACVEELAKAPWVPGQWGALLSQSRTFADRSGMLEEKQRARIFSSVRKEVLLGGWQGEMAVRLCMLGSSVAVLPRELNQQHDAEALKALAERLEQQGVRCMLTTIAPLSPLD